MKRKAFFAIALLIALCSFTNTIKLTYVSGFVPYDKYGVYNIDQQLAVWKYGYDLPDLYVDGATYRELMNSVCVERDGISIDKELGHLIAKPMTAEMVAGSQIANLYHCTTKDGKDSVYQMDWQAGRPKNGNQPYTHKDADGNIVPEMAIIYDCPEYWETRGSSDCLNLMKGYRVYKQKKPCPPIISPAKKDTGSYDMSGFTNSGGNSTSSSSASASISSPINLTFIGGFPGTQNTQQTTTQTSPQLPLDYYKKRGNAGNVLIPVGTAVVGGVIGYFIGHNNPKKNVTYSYPITPFPGNRSFNTVYPDVQLNSPNGNLGSGGTYYSNQDNTNYGNTNWNP